MKLHTQVNVVDRSGGVGVEHEFKIKATAKAFSILSSGLYSDKIFAILRELSCNAWDAHVAAGKRDVPIEVKLPNALDPTFYVKDYGTGLDHESMITLYQTFFDSTKTDSNDVIGALGLGSKSPLSYTNSFTVESRFKGMKRLYTVFIGETGVPRITLMGEQRTDEDNGLTVSLPVRQEDFEKFAVAARNAFAYFDPLPNVRGAGSHFTPKQVKYAVTGTNWSLREHDYNNTGAQVIQGLVAYPIDEKILVQHGLSPLACKVIDLDLDLKVNIGDVEVAASREALSYTPQTVKNLINVIEIVAKEMHDSIQKEFDKCATRWEANLLHAKMGDYYTGGRMYKVYNDLSRTKPFKWKGIAVVDELKLDLRKIRSTQIAICHRGHTNKVLNDGKWNPSMMVKEFSFSVHAGMTVLVDDLYNSREILREYINEQAKKRLGDRENRAYTLVLRGLSKKNYNQKEIDDILKQLDVENVSYISKLPYKQVARAKQTYRVRKLNEVLVWNGFPTNGGYRRNQLRRVFSRLCWTGATVDINKGGCYVMVDRFTVNHNGNEATMFDLTLSTARKIGIKVPDEIYGLTEKQVAAVKNNPKWKNVFDLINDEWTTLNAKDAMVKRVVFDRVCYHLGNGVARHLFSQWDTLAGSIEDGLFKSVVESIVETDKNGAKKLATDSITNFLQYGKSSVTMQSVETKANALVAQWRAVLNKHGMLKVIDWNIVKPTDISLIVDYVNLIAKGKV